MEETDIQNQGDMDKRNNRLAVAYWAIGLATLAVTPSVYFFFETLGGPFESVFVGNFYHVPLETRLEPIALLISLAVAIAGSVALALLLRYWFGRAFPTVRLIVSFMAVLYGLNFIRSGVLFWFSLSQIAATYRASPVISFGLTAVVMVISLFILIRYSRSADAILTRLVQAYSPVAAIIAVNVIAAIVVLRPYMALQVPLADPIELSDAAKQGRQFVWMIFDQADEQFIFAKRDPSVSLPNFDRLKAMSISTSGMFSPVPMTNLAVPAMTLGRKVNVIIGTPDSPLIELADGSFAAWSELPNVFSDLRAAGVDVRLLVQEFNVGGLCRIHAKVVSKCWQESRWRGQSLPLQAIVAGDVHSVFKRFLYAMPLVKLLSPEYFHDVSGLGMYPPGFHEETLLTMRDAAIAEITRPVSTDRLLYVHWNVPHQPYIYDRHEDKFVAPQGGTVEAYLNNLELMDVILGSILDALASSDSRQRTTLLVTADHGTDAVKGEPRNLGVPFLLHSPRYSVASSLKGIYSTTSYRALIKQYFEHGLDSVDEVKRIISASPDIGSSTK
jgi:hypothetical protein